MTETAKAFRREIDLKDGSGVQVFEGDTAEEVMDKLAEAQANATRKIADLSEKNKNLNRRVLAQPESGEGDPDGPMIEFRPREFTSDEAFALGQRLQNPGTAAAALREAIEAGLGATFDQVRKALRRAETTPRQIRGREAAEQFLLNHPELITDEYNQKELFGYMEHPSRRMALTVQNFEIAYDALSAAGLLHLHAPQATSTNGKGTQEGGRAADSAPPAAGASTPKIGRAHV